MHIRDFGRNASRIRHSEEAEHQLSITEARSVIRISSRNYICVANREGLRQKASKAMARHRDLFARTKFAVSR